MNKMREQTMKRWLAATVVFMLAVACMGCFSKENKDKVKDLEFTVVEDAQVPEELKELIEQKKEKDFKLTYSNEDSLYIVVGYGQQPTGGYSIQVRELYLTDNAIVLDTELIGPEKGEDAGTEPSFPYIVIKTELLEEQVVFQ